MTRRLTLILAAVALGAGTGGAVAVGRGTSAPAPRDAYSTCLKHADNTFAMGQCVIAERKRLKRLLDAAYAKLANDPNDTPRHKRQLANAQRAWRGYEKRDCAYAGGFFAGGTIEPFIEGDCLVTRERRRLADLREYAKGPEG